MSELISGKEALIALANGEELQMYIVNKWEDLRRDISWRSILGENYKLRLKPRTITINGIEVPAPFEPKEGDVYFYMTNFYDCGYDSRVFNSKHIYNHYHIQAWRSEEEIKQVVAALRSIFNEKTKEGDPS